VGVGPITAQVGIGFGIGFRNCDVWMRKMEGESPWRSTIEEKKI
jgi:hypothetical protein